MHLKGATSVYTTLQVEQDSTLYPVVALRLPPVTTQFNAIKALLQFHHKCLNRHRLW